MTAHATRIISFIVLLNSLSSANQVFTPENGIGMNIGAEIFYPTKVNAFVDNLYDELVRGYSHTDYGTVPIIVSYQFKGKGILYLFSQLCLEPYIQAMWAPKPILTTGAVQKSQFINVFDFSGGLNFWFKPSIKKRVQFKMGAGAFIDYGILKTSGDLGEVTLSGFGFGGNILSGIDIVFEKLAVNIDFIVPIGWVHYTDKDGSILVDDPDHMWQAEMDYPENLSLIGFQFRPGVTFHF